MVGRSAPCENLPRCRSARSPNGGTTEPERLPMASAPASPSHARWKREIFTMTDDERESSRCDAGNGPPPAAQRGGTSTSYEEAAALLLEMALALSPAAPDLDRFALPGTLTEGNRRVPREADSVSDPKPVE